jgi:hypothetical protein
VLKNITQDADNKSRMKEALYNALSHPLAKPALALITIGSPLAYCFSAALDILKKVQG